MFQRATRKQLHLRIALCGPAGSGKSFSALRIGASLLEPGQRMGVIDTEHGSAELYADEPNPDGGHFEFDCARLDLMPGKFSPENYLRAIRSAADGGYGVLVVDSLSHAWAGPGGVLDYVDEVKRRSKSGDGFGAWRQGTEAQNRLVDALLSFPGHLVCTMRTKVEYVTEKGPSGKSVIRKIGLAPVQRDGVEYEFTVVGDIDTEDHRLVVTKSRCSALADRSFVRPGRDVGDVLKAWLAGGAPMEAPAPAPEPEGLSWVLLESALVEAGLDVDDVLWHAWQTRKLNLRKAEPADRSRALWYYTSEDGQSALQGALVEVRKRFRTAFMSRWSTFWPAATQKGGASKEDQQADQAASDAARRTVMGAWYGTDSVKTVPLMQIVGSSAAHGLDWLGSCSAEEFAAAARECGVARG